MGITASARATLLATLLPGGTDRWVALYEGDPAGAGVELTVDGYARVAVSSWVTTVDGTTSTRANIGSISFDVVNGPAVADYYAIFDAEVAGNMLVSDVLRDDIDQVVAILMIAGDNVKLADGALRVAMEATA